MSQYSKLSSKQLLQIASNDNNNNISSNISNSDSEPSHESTSSSFTQQGIQSWAIPMILVGLITRYMLLSSNCTDCTPTERSTTFTTDTSMHDIENTLAYSLILIGYLLVLGVGVILMRRKRALARTRNELLSTSTTTPTTSSAEGLSIALSPSPFSIFTYLSNRSLENRINNVTKVMKFTEKENEHVECAVCLSNIEDNQVIRKLSCNHSFHKCCADLWLITAHKSKCPMCMHPIFESHQRNQKCSPSSH